jgi:hypothetical protein
MGNKQETYSREDAVFPSSEKTIFENKNSKLLIKITSMLIRTKTPIFENITSIVDKVSKTQNHIQNHIKDAEVNVSKFHRKAWGRRTVEGSDHRKK